MEQHSARPSDSARLSEECLVAPADAPEIVVAALVEHGGHGGSAAGPSVQRGLARYFEKRAVEQESAQVAWVGPRSAGLATLSGGRLARD